MYHIDLFYKGHTEINKALYRGKLVPRVSHIPALSIRREDERPWERGWYRGAIQWTLNEYCVLRFNAAGKKRGDILNKKPSRKDSPKKMKRVPNTGKMVVKNL